MEKDMHPRRMCGQIFLFNKRTGKIKNHLNLQIDSGIVELFESLLPNKEINFKNRSRIMDVCRDWHGLNTTKTNSNTLEEFLI